MAQEGDCVPAKHTLVTVDGEAGRLKALKELADVSNVGGQAGARDQDVVEIFARARHLSGNKLITAKTEFQKMLDLGIIRPSKSAWSSPLHVVPKANGSWRPCGDYRRLNLATADDRYPLPHVKAFTSATAGSVIFSVVDLVRGYHQFPMADVDVQKMAIITPFGLFEFLHMPFGLKNSAQAFQHLMDGVLRGLEFCFVYLDFQGPSRGGDWSFGFCWPLHQP